MSRDLLLTLLALLLLGSLQPSRSSADALADSTRPEFYGASRQSLAGRFHRLAFLPTEDWYMPNTRWDSVRTALEPLLVAELRSAGFEVVDRDKGVAICTRLADSLGGNFDRRKGRVDPERVAILVIQTRLALLMEYKPDGLISWGTRGSKDERGLVVAIENSGGSSVYRNEIEGAAYDYAHLFRAVLEPFCYAVRPISGLKRGSGRR